MTKNDFTYSFPIDEDEKTDVLMWCPREAIEWECEIKGSLPVYLYLNLMATANNFAVISTKGVCDFVGFNYGTNSAKTVKKANSILTYLHCANAILNCPQFKGIADTIHIRLNPRYFKVGYDTNIIFRCITMKEYETVRNYMPEPQAKHKSSFAHLLLIYMYIKSRIGVRKSDASVEIKTTYPLVTATAFTDITATLEVGNPATVSQACNILKQMGLIYFDNPVRITVNGMKSPKVMKTLFVESKAAGNGRNDWQWEYAVGHYNYIDKLTKHYKSLGQTISVKTGLPSEVYLYLQNNKQQAEAVVEKAADELF